MTRAGTASPGTARYGPGMRVVGRVVDLVRLLWRQVAAFGVVGVVALVVDVALFNWLMYAGGGGVLEGRPIEAKIASSAAATVVSWLGNRYLTFRSRRRPRVHHEFALFVVMCTAGLLITLGILWFSHDVLGFTSPLATNVAGNGIGLAAGTAFRFWAYRQFVFNHAEPGEEPEIADVAAPHAGLHATGRPRP